MILFRRPCDLAVYYNHLYGSLCYNVVKILKGEEAATQICSKLVRTRTAYSDIYIKKGGPPTSQQKIVIHYPLCTVATAQ